MKFDWHGGEIHRSTIVDDGYKNTRNVRRFLSAECGPAFQFDRDFMAWIANGRSRKDELWWGASGLRDAH